MTFSKFLGSREEKVDTLSAAALSETCRLSLLEISLVITEKRREPRNL